MRFSIALTLVLSFVTCAPSSRADVVSLSDAVRLALARNERSKIANLQVVSAEAAVHRARAGFLPTLSLGASESLKPIDGADDRKWTSANGTLTLNQPIVTVTTFPLYASAKHSYDATRFSEIDQRRQLASDAARSFFAVITEQRILVAAQSRFDRADATLRDTQARATAGLVSSNDVTRSAVDRASAVQSLATAQSSLERARLDLGYVLDLEVSGDLDSPDATLAPFALDVGSLLKLAVSQRPDLLAASRSTMAASASAEEPGLRLVPTVNASAQARVQDQPVVPNSSRYIDSTVTFNLNWAIWDAGVRDADSDQRHAALHTAELQQRALLRRVQADVRSAVSELVAARAALDAAKEGLAQSEKSVEETNVLYKQGLAKAIELVDSNASRFDAEVTLAAAQLDVRRSELDLRDALGLFPVDGIK
ncbi:MAG TPA: TolC family protein [Polyangiaceae bacterium]|jgi:outer membrane protein TolC|nr:TolC family protein [Polyangiaceae bacterium]